MTEETRKPASEHTGKLIGLYCTDPQCPYCAMLRKIFKENEEKGKEKKFA